MFHVVKNRCITQGAQPGALRWPGGVNWWESLSLSLYIYIHTHTHTYTHTYITHVCFIHIIRTDSYWFMADTTTTLWTSYSPIKKNRCIICSDFARITLSGKFIVLSLGVSWGQRDLKIETQHTQTSQRLDWWSVWYVMPLYSSAFS